MSGETLQIFLAVFGVWGLLVAGKALSCLTSGKRYVFSQWDGGLIRKGKAITPTGVKVKMLTAGTMGIGCMLWLSRAVPFKAAQYTVISAAVLSVIFDFVFVDPSSE